MADGAVDEAEVAEPVVDAVSEDERGEAMTAETGTGYEPEPVLERPIVDADVAPVEDDDEDEDEAGVEEDEVNGNVVGSEPKKPAARKRKTAARALPARPSRAAKAPRPRARKSSR